MHALTIPVGNFLARNQTMAICLLVLCAYALAVPPEQVFGSEWLEHLKDQAAAAIAVVGLALRVLVVWMAGDREQAWKRLLPANILILAGIFLMHGHPYVLALGITVGGAIFHLLLKVEPSTGGAEGAAGRWSTAASGLSPVLRKLGWEWLIGATTVGVLFLTEIYEYLPSSETDAVQLALLAVIAAIAVPGVIALRRQRTVVPSSVGLGPALLHRPTRAEAPVTEWTFVAPRAIPDDQLAGKTDLCLDGLAGSDLIANDNTNDLLPLASEFDGSSASLPGAGATLEGNGTISAAGPNPRAHLPNGSLLVNLVPPTAEESTVRVTRRPTSVLVGMARMRHTFLPEFARRSAEHYESHRQGVRWDAEREVFRNLYARVAPRTVLDCPVGTGRWLDIYQDAGASVLGVDLSPHMLAEATKKLRQNGRVRLVEGDVLDPSHRDRLGTGHDLIVCTRFTHWLPTRKLTTLVEAFAGTGPRFLIVGSKVHRDLKADPPQRQSQASVLKRARSAILNGSVNHIHDEEKLLALLRKAGFTLLDGTTITKTRSSVYKFYLLEFDPTQRGFG